MDTASPYPLTGTLLSAPEFPLPRSLATPLKLFFSPNSKLDTVYPPSSSASFSLKDGEVSFEHTFDRETVLCGAVNMHLFVSLHGGLKDADLHVYLEKLTTAGKVCGQLMIPFSWTWQSLFLRGVASFSAAASSLLYKGPYGCARVSSTCGEPDVEGMPVYPVGGGERRQVEQGEILRVRPCVMPMGMRFWRGERLRVRVRGGDERVFQGLDGALTVGEGDWEEGGEGMGGEEGKGEVRVWFGGERGRGSWVEVDAVLG